MGVEAVLRTPTTISQVLIACLCVLLLACNASTDGGGGGGGDSASEVPGGVVGGGGAAPGDEGDSAPPSSLAVKGQLAGDTDEFVAVQNSTTITGANLQAAGLTAVVDYFAVENGAVVRRQFSTQAVSATSFDFAVPANTYAVAKVGGLEALIPPMSQAPAAPFLLENNSKKAADVFTQMMSSGQAPSVVARPESVPYTSVAKLAALLEQEGLDTSDPAVVELLGELLIVAEQSLGDETQLQAQKAAQQAALESATAPISSDTLPELAEQEEAAILESDPDYVAPVDAAIEEARDNDVLDDIVDAYDETFGDEEQGGGASTGGDSSGDDSSDPPPPPPPPPPVGPDLTEQADTTIATRTAMTPIDINDASGGDTDGDGDALTYDCYYDETVDGMVADTLACADLGIVFGPTDGSLSWTPTSEAVYEIKVVATGDGLSDETIFSLTVNYGGPCTGAALTNDPFANWPLGSPPAGAVLICTADQLNRIYNATTYDTETPAQRMTRDYILGRNIDLTGETIERIGDSTNPFAGNFDGDLYRLENMSITTGGGTRNGLFDETAGATIENLFMTNATITVGSSYTGVLIGSGDSTVIRDVHITINDVDGGNYTGGMAGRITNGSDVDRVSVRGVAANRASEIHPNGQSTGGLFGVVGNTTIDDALVQNLTIRKTSNIGNQNTGGLVGNYVGSGSSIQNSLVDDIAIVSAASTVGGFIGSQAAGSGMVTSNAVTGSSDIEGWRNTGGFVGYSSEDVTACSAYVNVVGTDDNVGGFVGRITDGVPDPVYDNNLVVGNVNVGAAAGDGEFVGGFVGELTDVIIMDSFAAVNVCDGDCTAATTEGPFIATRGGGSGNATGSFYDSTTTVTDNGLGATGISTAAFKTDANMNNIVDEFDTAMWDTAVWQLDPANIDVYPTLLNLPTLLLLREQGLAPPP